MFDDLADLILDPDLGATTYTVIRTPGRWEKRRFYPMEPQRLDYYGLVQPANTRDLEQLPEGDRVNGVMKFMCRMPHEIYMTRPNAISDEIEWRGERYKVIQTMPRQHYGWMTAFAARKGAATDDG